MELATAQALKILIVEDDLVDRKILERLLSESSLHIAAVRSTDHLASALEILRSDQFDIVLLDLGLPDCDGVQTFATLQAHHPRVPVIVLSGLDDENVATTAVQKGVQDYLVKGYVDGNLLTRSVRYAVERKKAERELFLAEQRYRTIFQNSAVAITMADEQERLISWNQFTEDLLGMERADLYLRPITTLYPESEWERIRSLNIRQRGVHHHLETKMTKKSGEVIDVDVMLSMLKDAGGTDTGSIAVIRDVTERKQFEEALRRSEERFRQVVENAEEWIWEIDTDGLCTYASPIVEKILGYRPEELLQKKRFFDLLHPEERHQLASKLLEVFGHRKMSTELTARAIHKSGETVWLSLSGVPILDEDRNLAGYRGVAVDITERTRIHEILDHKQRNLEAIFDATPIGMLLVGEDMKISRANEAIRQMVGREYSQIINELPGSALGCVHFVQESASGRYACGAGPACAVCSLTKTIGGVLDSDQPVHGVEIETTFEIGHQKKRPWLSVSVEPVIIDGRKHAVVALNDITERKRAEQELQETMEIKSQIISTVSHELRTPLASMKEAVLIVLNEVAGAISEDQRRFLDIAKRNIDRLARLINDVLDFQKVSSGQMQYAMKENDITKAIEDACNTMLPSARKQGVHLSVELEDNLPRTVFDSDRIIQVVTNLVSNAVKFTPEGGHVSVRLQRRDQELVIAVSDTGMGIPKEALSRVFDRFYRVPRPGIEIKGTGLGLAIVKRIVVAHGGRIDVESKLEKGTTFTVFLPLAPKPQREPLPETTDQSLERTLAEK